jgi:hypothetical protein
MCYVVIEKAMGWSGELVRTRRIGVFRTPREAENCVRDRNLRPARADDCYSIYSIEPKPFTRP